jgi:hypothetical protein
VLTASVVASGIGSRVILESTVTGVVSGLAPGSNSSRLQMSHDWHGLQGQT